MVALPKLQWAWAVHMNALLDHLSRFVVSLRLFQVPDIFSPHSIFLRQQLGFHLHTLVYSSLRSSIQAIWPFYVRIAWPHYLVLEFWCKTHYLITVSFCMLTKSAPQGSDDNLYLQLWVELGPSEAQLWCSDNSCGQIWVTLKVIVRETNSTKKIMSILENL